MRTRRLLFPATRVPSSLRALLLEHSVPNIPNCLALSVLNRSSCGEGRSATEANRLATAEDPSPPSVLKAVGAGLY